MEAKKLRKIGFNRINKFMKDLLIRAIVIVLVICFGYLVFKFSSYLIKQDNLSEEIGKQSCESEDGVWNQAYEICELKYEKCLRIVRTAFEDLTDTRGVSQNNEDAVSKTMEREINRCLEKI